jgi:hypothetical protein
MCFIVHKTTSELERTILATLYLAGGKNTDSWHARKGDLQCIFPLDVPMVPSSALVVSTDGARLTCGGFSLSKIVRLGRFQFIADYFGYLSLSPKRADSCFTFMGSTCDIPPLSMGG